MHQLFSYSLFFIIVTSGCQSFSGTPRSPLDFKKIGSEIESDEDLLNKYSHDFALAAITEPKTEEERNNLISKAQIIIDYRYLEFTNDAESERKTKDFTADMVELSMNLAGAAVGSTATKTLLAAISAGINGANNSIDKNYFYEKGYPSLVAQMNSDRKEVLKNIERGKGRSLINYPWSQAVFDLIRYYNAGTLFNANSSIQKQAGKREVEASIEIERLINERVSRKTVSMNEKLITALQKIDKQSLERIDFKNLSAELADVNSCQFKKPDNPMDAQTALQACLFAAAPVGASDESISKKLSIFQKYFTQAGIIDP